MPRWFRWRGRLWHLRVYRNRDDRWVGHFARGLTAEYLSHGPVAWCTKVTHYICPLPTLVIELWRYES